MWNYVLGSPLRWCKAGCGTWTASCFQFDRPDEGKHRGRPADAQEYDDRSYQYFCLKATRTDSHVSVGAVPSSCSWLQLLRPLELSRHATPVWYARLAVCYSSIFVPPPRCSSLCSDRGELANVGSMLIWNDTVRDPALRPRQTCSTCYVARTTLAKFGLHGQHGIQYIKWSMSKYNINM